ncbi:hypothetical protein AMECASPLE_029350, partial [Ameca splendens]
HDRLQNQDILHSEATGICQQLQETIFRDKVSGASCEDMSAGSRVMTAQTDAIKGV